MKAFLIDGNSFCYRAHYAVKNLSTKTGKPTGAVFGFVNMLNKIIKDEKPDLLGVAFDLKVPTFRHKKFKEYKLGRPPMPQDLVEQMPLIKEVVRSLRVPIFQKEGFEAEDVIASIAVKLEERNCEVFIVSGDKDMFQLVNERIKIYNTNKDGFIYTEEEIEKRFGVGPEKVIDIMALMGDKIDNIPGVKGIGEVTAKKLIREFGSLDNLYKNIERVKQEKLKNMLLAEEEKARLSRELATIDTAVDVEFNIEELKLKEPDSQKLTQLFKELEFRSFLKDYKEADTDGAFYHLIKNENEFLSLVDKLKRQSFVCFDFETTSADPFLAEIVGISFSLNEKEAFYVPVKTVGAVLANQENMFASANNTECLDVKFVMKNLRPLFENESMEKIGQNIKYEMIILKNSGIDLKGRFFDTMVASYLLNPSKLNHNLEDIAFEYLNYSMTTFEDLLGKGKNKISILEVNIENLKNYACEDADITLRLKYILEKKMKEENLFDLFFEIEMPLVGTLSWMEESGLSIDTALLEKMSGELEGKLGELTEKIYEEAGEKFNINSPKQLQGILFEKLKLKPAKRTKTGPSTDVEVLAKLSKEHNLPALLLEYRELAKLKSTYVDALPKLINPVTGRLHTSFNQTVTQTGRLSSSNPNLQNIPVKAELGRRIRKAFIAGGKDHLILAADYSQIELRIMAHFSKDPVLVDAFKNDMDIHSHTASLIFGVEEEEVTKSMRSIAKTVNFGIIYGMSPYGLAKELDIEIDKAKEFIEAYFRRYPKVKEYIDEQVEFASAHGYVCTLFGRKRYIPQINSDDIQLRNFAVRTVINTPIQGTASDIIKKAMNEVYSEFRKRKLNSKMILQVHDELVFETASNEVEEVKNIVRDCMCRAGNILNVPVKVSLKAGKNWLEAEEI
ncbi:MAG: DNA polymerase I [Candidatus Omnitrophota bacterium]